MGLPLAGLWLHADFRKLWAGQTISLLGSQVTLLALPLVAVLMLDATPVQMGVLGAAEYTPFLLVGLLAGAWVDRFRRRPILIGADLGRAAILASVPVAAATGLLRMEYLYAVGFLVGLLTLFYDVAYAAFLPALVERDKLIEANSKLAGSASVAQIAGPGLAGGLVQLLTAPVAMILDAVSFLISAMAVGLIRTPEAAPERDGEHPSMWGQVGEGVRLVAGNPILRTIAGCTGTWNLFSNAALAVYVLYLTRDVGIEPAILGFILAARGPGALVGAAAAGPSASRLGLGTTLLGATLLGVSASLLIPLAGGPLTIFVGVQMAAQFLIGLTGSVYNINQVSLRQAITPDWLLGRMTATMRFVIWGTIPLGSLMGGALGEMIGLRPTLLATALAALVVFFWLAASPVRSVREPPRAPA